MILQQLTSDFTTSNEQRVKSYASLDWFIKKLKILGRFLCLSLICSHKVKWFQSIQGLIVNKYAKGWSNYKRKYLFTLFIKTIYLVQLFQAIICSSNQRAYLKPHIHLLIWCHSNKDLEHPTFLPALVFFK